MTEPRFIGAFLFSSFNITRSFWDYLMKWYFFMSVMPSWTRRFKFTVSWHCYDHVATEHLLLFQGHRLRAITASSPRCRRTIVVKMKTIFILSRELVGDSRMGTAIGLRSRCACSALPLSFFFRPVISCVETVHVSIFR
jgi:hypothetical protein